jgi:hypothetical protein
MWNPIVKISPHFDRFLQRNMIFIDKKGIKVKFKIQNLELSGNNKGETGSQTQILKRKALYDKKN